MDKFEELIKKYNSAVATTQPDKPGNAKKATNDKPETMNFVPGAFPAVPGFVPLAHQPKVTRPSLIKNRQSSIGYLLGGALPCLLALFLVWVSGLGTISLLRAWGVPVDSPLPFNFLWWLAPLAITFFELYLIPKLDQAFRQWPATLFWLFVIAIDTGSTLTVVQPHLKNRGLPLLLWNIELKDPAVIMTASLLISFVAAFFAEPMLRYYFPHVKYGWHKLTGR